MDISEAILEQIIAGIWTSVLELEVQPRCQQLAPDAPDLLTGRVQITSAWEGAIVVVCAGPVARRAAAIMFGVELSAVTPRHAHDALGELSNMVAGNFKGLVPQPAFLSLPTVVDGADEVLHVPDSHLLIQMTFESEGAPFLVAVFERDGQQALESAAEAHSTVQADAPR